MSREGRSDPSAHRHRRRFLREPTEQLGRQDKLLREASHRRLLLTVLVLIVIAVGFAALRGLESWADWIVFGAICMTAIGVIIAVSPVRARRKG